MEAYFVLFRDSFVSMFTLSLSNESAWFAARDFGVYDIFIITAVCFAGAVLGALCSLGLGYLCSMLKDRVFTVDEELYAKLSHKASKYGIYIFLFQMIPFIKLFFFFAGMFRIPFRRMLAVTLAGRAFYYLYYIFLYPMLPTI